MPFTQVPPEPQVWLHMPQLFGSVFVFTQEVPQLVGVPAGHPHDEFVQAAPAGQTLPHIPQLFASFVVLTHAPPQTVSPAVEHEQTLLAHVAPVAQAVVQVPHAAGSLVRSRQPRAAPQLVWPVGQTHAPFVQVALPGQTLPHAPQLFESVIGFVQTDPEAPGHVTFGMVQLPHWLFAHITVPPHAAPQLPQLLGSVVVSTHAVPQVVEVAEHAQTPPLQDCPVPQAMPHPPQFAESVRKSVHWPGLVLVDPQTVLPAAH
jgi:hypothetical protein